MIFESFYGVFELFSSTNDLKFKCLGSKNLDIDFPITRCDRKTLQ
jgi:hypothetical protein